MIDLITCIQRRLEKYPNLSEYSRMTNLSRQMLIYWESGKIEPTDIEKVLAYIQPLHIEIDEIYIPPILPEVIDEHNRILQHMNEEFRYTVNNQEGMQEKSKIANRYCQAWLDWKKNNIK